MSVNGSPASAAADDRIDRLYELLPLVHRARDAERGEPLRALLQVIAEQVNVVEDDIARLYDNWFIETCDEWVVPYLGDLIGYQPVHEAGESIGAADSAEQRARTRILAPRLEVANTIRYRRRKGTLALLALLARDVAGWPARAVEFQRLLATSQALNQQQPTRGRTIDLRDGGALDHLGGAFEASAHNVDLHSTAILVGRGRYHPGNVGIFVWRLRAYTVTHTRAYKQEKAGSNAFTFSALGNDAPLFIRPARETDPEAIAGEANVPARLRRHTLERTTVIDDKVPKRASPDYYGVVPGTRIGASLALWAEHWPDEHHDPAEPIPANHVIPADLSDWSFVPPADHVAVDPVLGRLVFPPKQLPREHVYVSYHYGFPADMGGGEYDRPQRAPSGAELRRVATRNELHRELQPWRDTGGGTDTAQPAHAIIEITESGIYELPIRIALAPGHTLQIRAAPHTRPVIRLLDWEIDQSEDIVVAGGAGSRFTLDGLLVAGRGIRVTGELASFTVRHSTLVPGWTLEPNCEPWRPSEPSIRVIDCGACIVIDHSIVGSIQIDNNEITMDPVTLRIADSIVDATGSDCDGPRCEAIGTSDSGFAHATLDLARSTVVGKSMVHRIDLATDAIFTGRLTVARRQTGCVRFSSLPSGSRTPRRYHCQPDLALAAGDPGMEDAERERVRPRFTTLRYGHPGYAQLAQDCAPEIAEGAEDSSEMGAFHDLFQAQRRSNLRARLDEFVPAGAAVTLVQVT